MNKKDIRFFQLFINHFMFAVYYPARRIILIITFLMKQGFFYGTIFVLNDT